MKLFNVNSYRESSFIYIRQGREKDIPDVSIYRSNFPCETQIVFRLLLCLSLLIGRNLHRRVQNQTPVNDTKLYWRNEQRFAYEHERSH